MENWELALKRCAKVHGVREPEDKGKVERRGTRFLYKRSRKRGCLGKEEFISWIFNFFFRVLLLILFRNKK